MTPLAKVYKDFKWRMKVLTPDISLIIFAAFALELYCCTD